jgi:hypothetical protein
MIEYSRIFVQIYINLNEKTKKIAITTYFYPHNRTFDTFNCLDT